MLPALSLFIRNFNADQFDHYAFLFAAVGDFLLYYDYISEWYFMAGMVSFAICHLHFIGSTYGPQPKGFKFMSCILSLSLGLLFPILSYMTIPIIFYALLLLKWLVGTIHHGEKQLICGCILFIISDILILIRLVFKDFPHAALPLYWLSIYLVATTPIDREIRQKSLDLGLRY